MRIDVTAAVLTLLAASTAFAVDEAGETETATPVSAFEQPYQPQATVERYGVRLTFPMSVRTRFEGVEDYPLDRDGTDLGSNFFILPEFRLGARFENVEPLGPFRIMGEYEHDLATGTAYGTPDIAGADLPNGEKWNGQLRKLFVRVDAGDYLAIAGGYMTSHWGLGMLANDGDHRWEPGSARFSDPRFGDRVVRAWIGSQPVTDYRLVWRFAYDDVQNDDILRKGDDAYQYIISARVGDNLPTQGGIYVVYRDQDSNQNRGFEAWVIDLMGLHSFEWQGVGTVKLGAEGAVVTGDTNLGPTPDLPRQDLLQFAAVTRAALERRTWGLVFSLLYASGDEDIDDDERNAFQVDPNYEFGLLLYRQVIAAQTGRGVATASDPNLIGRPPPDIDRLSTGGSPTNSIALFPAGWFRPNENLEVYGGPLFAFAEVDNVDPFNTRIAGGAHRNALDGNPGGFWGVELDAGMRSRFNIRGTQLTLGLEGGIFFPGSALREPGGGNMENVIGGRAMFEYRM
jgi:hypothetical protein